MKNIAFSRCKTGARAHSFEAVRSETSRRFSNLLVASGGVKSTEVNVLLRVDPKTLKSFADLVDAHIDDMLEIGKPLRRSKVHVSTNSKSRIDQL